MNKFIGGWVLAALAVLAVGTPVRGVAAGKGAADPLTELGLGGGRRSENAVTVITSEKLTFDYKKQYALFERNVVVTDPDMKLTADQLMVKFSAQGQAESIKAEGHVVIAQTDKTAKAEVATYDVASGRIVLAGKPVVTRGRDQLEGEVITFWRDENKMVCQPGARLVIYPQKGERDQFLGDKRGR